MKAGEANKGRAGKLASFVRRQKGIAGAHGRDTILVSTTRVQGIPTFKTRKCVQRLEKARRAKRANQSGGGVGRSTSQTLVTNRS